MKIAFLATGMGVGGAEQQILYLSQGLMQRGHDVLVLSIAHLGPAGAEAQSKGIPIESLGIRRGTPDFRAIPRLVRILRRFKPDVLCSFMFHANLLGRLVGRMTGVPVVISSIRNENFGGCWREWAMRLTDWLSVETVTNSTLAAHSLIKRRVVPGHRLRVIPNGINLEPFSIKEETRRQMRKQWAIDERVFLWVSVGRLKEQKDFFTLLKASHILKDTDFRLIIVGPGPLKECLSKTARELGLENNVLFLGFRQDVPMILAASDGFVLSSAWEGLPNAVMEASSSGLPVVATNVGGVAELVVDGKSGFLVPAKDADRLADALLQTMNLPKIERLAMGQCGRDLIQCKFDLQRVITEWEVFFAEHLKKKGISSHVPALSTKV